MRSLKSRVTAASRVAAVFAFGALLSTTAHAVTITNGGFETGDLTGWSELGDLNVDTASVGTPPAEGTFHTLIGNTNAESEGAVEAFLGLSSGTLDDLAATRPGSNDVTEGSAIAQSVSGAAGDVIHFAVNFLTDEATPEFEFNDFSFVSLVGGGDEIIAVLLDTFSPFGPSAAGFDFETGYFAGSIALPSAGRSRSASVS